MSLSIQTCIAPVAGTEVTWLRQGNRPPQVLMADVGEIGPLEPMTETQLEKNAS